MSKFTTSINCMDGRVQIPVIEYIMNKYQVDYVDMITQPGANKILAERKDKFTLESIKKSIKISVNRHGSKLVAISGHYDCAGNPTNKEIQIKQIMASIEVIKSWNFDVQIIGLWINQNWQVEEVK